MFHMVVSNVQWSLKAWRCCYVARYKLEPNWRDRRVRKKSKTNPRDYVYFCCCCCFFFTTVHTVILCKLYSDTDPLLLLGLLFSPFVYCWAERTGQCTRLKTRLECPERKNCLEDEEWRRRRGKEDPNVLKTCHKSTCAVLEDLFIRKERGRERESQNINAFPCRLSSNLNYKKQESTGSEKKIQCKKISSPTLDGVKRKKCSTFSYVFCCFFWCFLSGQGSLFLTHSFRYFFPSLGIEIWIELNESQCELESVGEE